MIEVCKLNKRYGNHQAVTDLSFTIGDNHVYGLLGPNGAGKSTTMNIMTGCLAPSSGTVIVDGYDIYEDALEVKKRIGYLPELPPVYPTLTPEEYLSFVAKAKGIAGKDVEVQIRKAIEATGLQEYAGHLIKSLSKGYRQRVGIAQAIIGEPRLIILDEPMVGLDPMQIIEIRDLIKRLGEDHTVILSSHILSEVRSICDHLIIINRGRLVANDSPEALEQMYMAKSTVSLSVDASEEEVCRALADIEGLDSFTCTPAEDGSTRVVISRMPGKELNRAIFFAFSRIGKPILSMVNDHITLEDVFLELTRDSEDASGRKEAAAE